jgi:hypothetical protein
MAMAASFGGHAQAFAYFVLVGLRIMAGLREVYREQGNSSMEAKRQLNDV